MQSKNLNNAYLQCIAKIGCNITINSGCNYVKSEAKSFNIPAPMQNTIVSLIVLRYFKFAGKSITFKRNYSEHSSSSSLHGVHFSSCVTFTCY
jgi:hypothetical protein